jgi:hypothetical protein
MSDTALCEFLSNSHIRPPGSPTGNADPQEDSPLFNIFPPEIRAEIFGITVSSLPDKSRPYAFDSYWYRPGYTAPKRTHLSLLATCKRVYAETRDLVWKAGSGNDEETVWWGSDDRAPPPPPSSPKILTSSYWSRIHTFHIFSQMHAFKSQPFFHAFALRFGLRPHTVKVTIRYTDWWHWEQNAPLDITSIEPKDHREYVPPSVQTFVLELETAEHKKGELEEQVQRILDSETVWRWKRWDGVFLGLDKRVGVREWEWMGTTKFNGQEYAHHPKGDQMKYIVKVLTFSLKPSSESDRVHRRQPFTSFV